ncbi:MAG: hypothetical protein AAGA54_16485 [Myxococcota bacterium]
MCNDTFQQTLARPGYRYVALAAFGLLLAAGCADDETTEDDQLGDTGDVQTTNDPTSDDPTADDPTAGDPSADADSGQDETGDPADGNCAAEVVVTGLVEMTISSTDCVDVVAVPPFYELNYDMLGLSFFGIDGDEGSFDGDVVELTFGLVIDETAVSVNFESCPVSGSWTGAGVAGPLVVSGDVDCSNIVPRVLESFTDEERPDIAEMVMVAPFSFEWS